MISKPIVIFLFLVLIGIQARGQTQYACGTGNMDSAAFVNKPWVGNNQFLLDLIDSVGYGKAIPKSGIQGGFDTQAQYWIPVKAWVYNDDNGNGGIDEVEVEASIRRLNEYFAGEVNLTGHASQHTLIRFYLRCNIAYINNSDYAINPSDNEIDDMWDDNHETAALNVHYVQSLSGISGKARYPGSNKSFTIVIRTDVNSQIGSTFPHEVGHAFDVAHTHQGRCWFHSDNSDCSNCHQEAVSRAKIQPVGCGNFSGNLKCEVNGDGYCDTEADPNISGLVDGNTQDGFTYEGTGKDNWNELWTPDIYNIMSYSRVEAREYFSPMQVATMYYWILGLAPDMVFPSIFDLHNENEFIDIYEPDNFRHPNNTIEFGEVQHRGLHAIRFGLKSNPSFGYCDEDWVRFTVPDNISYEVNIFTSSVPGKQQVDTQISLLDATGNTVLTSNDDKASGDIYSEISGFELAAGDYWIMVESMGNSSGEYYLTLERCGEICCFQGLLGSATAINPSTGSFNLGLVTEGVEEFIGNSLDVSSILFFNNSSQLGFGGVGYPIPSSNLNAIICNNSEIIINNLGQMIFGDNASNRTANVRFLNGTKLILEEFGIITVQQGSKLIIEDGAELRINGGNLRVFDGGEVIIKSGGKLIYEKDTQIELNGNDAVLSLGGLTRIGDDATFTFTYQGSESGYIRMLKEGHWGQRFSAGINATIALEGENKNDLILYLEEDVDFWEFDTNTDIPGETYISHKFEEVTFKNGKIIMEEKARIVLLSKSRFQRTTVESLSPGHHPRGITPLTSCHISSSTFNRMPIDALLHYWESGSLLIETSTFDHSYVSVRGSGYRVRSSSFTRSLIHSEFNTLSKSIINSEFHHAPATAVTDWSKTDLFVFKTVFTDNKTGIWRMHGSVTAKCSQFIQNETAIMGDKESVVNLSTLYNGGYNYFSKNNYNIKLFLAAGLQLEDGYNELYYANIMNIEGHLDISSEPCPPALIAYNNSGCCTYKCTILFD